MTDHLLPPDTAHAARLLASGALVAFPTETVYGLGADARNAAAVAGIFAAKGRPAFNPLIVHVPTLEAARALAVFDPMAERLAHAFWPGPLSLVLPLRENAGLSDLISAGLPTVAIRVPAHPLAQDLLRHAGCPVAAPSANISGQISPTTAPHVLAGLDGKIAAVLDGGACAVGLESTILATNPLCLLRAGGVTAEQIAALIQAPLPVRDGSDAISAPGQLRSHYAPAAQMRLDAKEARQGEILLGFNRRDATFSLSDTGDLTEAATNLFARLRQADTASQGRRIAVSPIPDHGLGRAINDRLRRAAAPRDQA